MDEIKPCPFCGDVGDPQYVGGIVRCHKCGAEGPYLVSPPLNAWNTRAADKEALALLKDFQHEFDRLANVVGDADFDGCIEASRRISVFIAKENSNG